MAGWEAIQNGSLAEYMALANEVALNSAMAPFVIVVFWQVGEEVLEMSTSLTDGFEAVHDLLQKAAVSQPHPADPPHLTSL